MTKKTHILVVDDDIRFASSLADILTEKGYDTIAVNSGEDAIKKVKKIPFQLILMDVKMPVMDGIQACKEIKKITPQTTIVMMTAFSVEDVVKDALKEGAYGLVHKPLDIDRVIKMIETAKTNGCLVMVVDGKANMRESLRDILEEKGYIVTLADEGKEAVNLIKERPEDVIFIDMRLPALKELGTYLAIQKTGPKTIVIITAYRQEMKDIVEQALKKGAYTCLYKPFDPKEVVTIVEEIIKMKRK